MRERQGRLQRMVRRFDMHADVLREILAVIHMSTGHYSFWFVWLSLFCVFFLPNCVCTGLVLAFRSDYPPLYLLSSLRICSLSSVIFLTMSRTVERPETFFCSLALRRHILLRPLFLLRCSFSFLSSFLVIFQRSELPDIIV